VFRAAPRLGPAGQRLAYAAPLGLVKLFPAWRRPQLLQGQGIAVGPVLHRLLESRGIELFQPGSRLVKSEELPVKVSRRSRS